MIDVKYALIPSCADPEGDRGSGPPMESKNIGFLSNNGPDPLKITKLLSKHSLLGHHRYACETAFRWRADDGPLIVVLDPPTPHQLKKKLPKLSAY